MRLLEEKDRGSQRTDTGVHDPGHSLPEMNNWVLLHARATQQQNRSPPCFITCCPALLYTLVFLPSPNRAHAYTDTWHPPRFELEPRPKMTRRPLSEPCLGPCKHGPVLHVYSAVIMHA